MRRCLTVLAMVVVGLGATVVVPATADAAACPVTTRPVTFKGSTYCMPIKGIW
ncbi:hypothetical protein [Nocardiopsis ansamitocini]|uniref:Porin n=1 Tax=Nocardiopsis ansamitocini TaxID=1670832 RepID=A0A9W6P502_9ACTN|nr:hypothetical protein [Nocardiopsis ansamitocini]GLU47181.1 hypothetical protein Nans01_15320 [Nocardiopsis ansamitocini]